VEGKLEQVGRGVFAGIGVEGATNFGIIKGDDDTALLIDPDIRRIDEVQDALEKTGCQRVRYLFNTHEHFDHASSNQYFANIGIPIISSEACRKALKEDGQKQFDRMTKQAPGLMKRFPNLEVVCPHITFADTYTIHLPGVTVNVGIGEGVGLPDGCAGGDKGGDRSIWQTRSYRSRFLGFGIAMRGWKFLC